MLEMMSMQLLTSFLKHNPINFNGNLASQKETRDCFERRMDWKLGTIKALIDIFLQDFSFFCPPHVYGKFVGNSFETSIDVLWGL